VAPINVLWVIDHVCYDGSLHGGGRLYREVLPRFDPEQVRVVPCMLRADPTIRRLFADSPVPVHVLGKGKFDPTTLGALLRLIKDADIHVMHLHCYGASTFGRLAAFMTGVPAIIHDYDTDVYFPYPWYLWVSDRLLAPVTRAAIAASPMVHGFLARRRRIAPDRIVTLLHAVPRAKYRALAPERRRAVRAGLGLDDATPVVGTVTKLGPQRGNEDLLRAAALTLETVPDAVFLVMYKPTYFHRLPSRRYVEAPRADTARRAADLHALVRELGIEKSVRLVEWPDDLDEIVAACDVMTAPFLSERFSSVSVLDAMAMGKPVVATDVGELRLVVRHGVTGYLVPPGQVAELAAAIARVLGSAAERDRLGAQARVEAEQYSADAYVRRLAELYRGLAAGHAVRELGTGARPDGDRRARSVAQRAGG
jgi:glycosyltransferase involved in cell wall biosynthesis